MDVLTFPFKFGSAGFGFTKSGIQDFVEDGSWNILWRPSVLASSSALGFQALASDLECYWVVRTCYF